MTAPVLPATRPRRTLPLPRSGGAAGPGRRSGGGPPPRQLAHAHVAERADTVVIEFWVDRARSPLPLRRVLVAETFAHPAVRPGRSAVVSVPLGDSALLGEVGARPALARTRACGATCLIERLVRG